MEDNTESDSEPDIDEIIVETNNVYFYGEITKTKALKLNVALKKLEVKHLLKGIEFDIEPPPIRLHINSEGGDCVGGFSQQILLRL